MESVILSQTHILCSIVLPKIVSGIWKMPLSLMPESALQTLMLTQKVLGSNPSL